MSHEQFQSAIHACEQCAEQCDHLANEFAGSFGSLVRLCHDTAQLCWTTAAFLSRGSHFFPELCQLCARACKECADECEKSPDLEVMRGVEVFRRCAEECTALSREEAPQAAVLQGSAVATGATPTV
jgi:hypothetical protein